MNSSSGYKKAVFAYLVANKNRLRKEYHITKIGIFGSVARDETTDKSDIDLIVEFENNTPDLYGKKQKLKAEIQTRFNAPVYLCREKYIRPAFKDQILAEAKYA